MSVRAGQPQMGGQDWLLLIACAVFWGSAYTLNKITITELAPFTITAARLTIAVGILWMLVVVSRLRVPLDGWLWLQFLVYSGLTNVVPYWLVLYGQRETASGLAAVIGATSPLFTILLMRMFRGDQVLDWRKLVAIAMGIVGVAIVFGPQVLGGWSRGVEGKAALLLSAVLYAVGAIYARRFMHLDPRMISAMQMTAGLAITVPLSAYLEQPWIAGWPSSRVVLAVVMTALFGTVLASLAFFMVLRRQGPTNTMLVTLLVPVTPLALGALFFGEELAGREALGAAIIALSLVVIDGRLVRWLVR